MEDFAAEWDRFTDCEPTKDPYFLEKAEKEGLAELVPVTKCALQDPFAYERGIEKGGMMWQLTPSGLTAYRSVPTPTGEEGR
jgi:hypothetical protein